MEWRVRFPGEGGERVFLHKVAVVVWVFKRVHHHRGVLGVGQGVTLPDVYFCLYFSYWRFVEVVGWLGWGSFRYCEVLTFGWRGSGVIHQ